MNWLRKRRYVVAVLAMISIGSVWMTGCKSPAEKAYRQGKQYLYDGEYPEAIKAFKKTIQLDPQYRRAYVRLADAYADSGNTTATIQTYRQGIKAVPTYFKLHRRLAKVYYDRGEFINAKTVCEKALAQNAINKGPEEAKDIRALLGDINATLAKAQGVPNSQ